MAQNEKLAELSSAGVAVWLDDLSRDRIRSGNLQSLVDEHSVVGATTNPSIFAAAISGSDSYDDQVHALARQQLVAMEQRIRADVHVGAEVGARALHGLRKIRERRVRIGARVAHEDVAAVAAQQFVDAEVLEVAAV